MGLNLFGGRFDEPVIGLGAGIMKHPVDVERYLGSHAAWVTLGSITMEPRSGNDGTVYHPTAMASFNSYGMPNQGKVAITKALPELVRRVHDNGIRLVVSVAGFNPAENVELVETMIANGADGVEINCGCANVWDGGVQKPPLTFDLEGLALTLERVKSVAKGADIGIKVSPQTDPMGIPRIAKIVREADFLTFVTAVNTAPNTFVFGDNFQPALQVGGGLTSMSGPALKPIGLGQVFQYRKHLPPEIVVIGAGGISTGRDVYEYERAGANVVAVVTAAIEKGPGIVSRLYTEYLEIDEQSE